MSLARIWTRAQSLGLVESDAVEQEAEDWAALVADVRGRIDSDAVPAQRRFIADLSSWCLALCGRQCGKGWSVARMLVLTAMSRPDSVCIYARRTLGLAKTTMWLQEPTDGIPAVLRQLGLVDRDDPNRPTDGEWHYELNLSETSVRFRNGSVIRLIGVERQAGWADVRGHKFVLFVLDEIDRKSVV